jgi:hypothetical protein
MAMRFRIQLVTLDHYWSISTGICLTTLLNSPDLAPNDCYLFIYLKNWLRSQRFKNNEGLIESVKTWLSSQTADFFDTDIHTRIPRYDSRLSSGGDCVEK